MTDIGAWLRGLGLEQYEAAFRENAVDASVLLDLTAEDLREMGVAAVGHRRKLLAAIAALRGLPPSAVALPTAALPGDVREGHGLDGDGAERRQLTVFFCDLAGSTALSARLDPEDLREVMAVYHRTVVAAVRKKGGHVAKFLGDGVLAYFGWPRAHEDDAERAVGAGLAAVRAVAGLEMPAGPLTARVGIATGPVVVGDLHGEGIAREHGVAGETPNLAARLQGVAGPGQVVMDHATRRLTGTLFDCADLGEIRLNGLPYPVRVWRALAEGAVESRFEALRAGHAAPLVGREEELELLLRRWDRARAGEGRVVLLRGEAGIGKSRLTAALREALAAEEHEELVLYCAPQHTDSALHPIIARLERAAGLASGEVPEARLAKLEALLAPLAPPPEDVALIAELLSVPTLGRWPELDLSPQRRRELLLQALVRRMQGLAARRPVLMVVEDAHWLDPTTRELLDLLVAEVPEMALLLMVTHRPEFDVAAWLGLAQVTLMQLNRLGRAEHAMLLQRVAGDKALPPEVIAEVLARTDGVPLFVEEVGRSVLESDLLREEADRWVLNGPLTSVAVPSSLQASLVARLDRLSSVREAVQAGSVLGREFAHDVMAAVSGLPEERLRDALGQLEAAGLLQRRGEPPGAVYTFRHTLIQDAAQGTLLRERKRDLHRRAAEAIERLRPEIRDREPELLAHHWAEAGVVREAIEFYRRAGERSAAHSFLREARAHFAAALGLLVRLPHDTWRDRTELELQIPLASATPWVEGQAAPAAGQVYARARQLCQQLGETKQLIPVLAGLAVHHTNRAEPETACVVAEEMLRVALTEGDVAAELSAQRLLGYAWVKRGRPTLARKHFERVLDLFDPVRHRVLGSGFPMDTRIGALSWLANTLFILGLPEQALMRGREALTEARALQHIQSLATALVAGGCSLHCLARDPEATRVHAEELEALSTRAPAFRNVARVYRGWAQSMLSDRGPGEGIARMQEALTDYRATGAGTVVPQALALLAEAHQRAGRPERGLGLLDEALAFVERGGERIFEAELHRIRGVLLLALPGEDGEPSLRRAIEVARAQEARMWELRAAMDLARLWQDRGRREQARDLLASTYSWFTEGFAYHDLVRARALLEELRRS